MKQLLPRFPGLLLLLATTTRCQQAPPRQPAAPAAPDAAPPTHTNALIHETSPYLLEHAHNPVQWHPWGPAALALARRENKPLLVSVGYAACHWCHVMARESFSDTAVAGYMNRHFVCIKVDREERPNVDQVYMQAAQVMTGSGGWPLNAFALPDGRPFYTVTYLPKNQWLNVLQQLTAAYTREYPQVLNQAALLAKGMRAADTLVVAPTPNSFPKTVYNSLYNGWQPFLTRDLNRAPRFPLPVAGEFLLQFHYLTGNKPALTTVETQLRQMARGGIYDQVGGGFARYSTDAQWKVPHFEKMLYDNGQLVSLYAHAYELTHDPQYQQVLDETLAFVARELTAPEGGFYASLNADSEGEEGRFYVWTQAEFSQLFDPQEAALLAAYYQVRPGGNWERGQNILYHPQADADFARQHHLTPAALAQLIQKAKATLLAARAHRVRPSTDDKILTAWNALMLKGYVDAYHATGNPAYLATALRNANFLQAKLLQPDGSLRRSYKAGRATIEAFLDDYALLAEAYLALYQATFDVQWLHQARQLTAYTLTHFADPATPLCYYTANTSAPLAARPRELTDNVIPAANSVLANNLFRLGEYFDSTAYTTRARQMLAQVAPDVARGGPYYANWARLQGLFTYPPFEVALLGPAATAEARQLQRHYLPTALFMGGPAENLPLLAGKLPPSGTRIYVCQDRTCRLPVSTPAQALPQLATAAGVLP